MFRIFSVSALILALAAPSGAAEPRRVVLDIPSMNCSLCPIAVKKALLRVPGVLEARASLATKSAEVRFDPDRTEPALLAKALANAGYPAAPREP